MKENQELIHLNPPVRINGTIGLIQGDLWIRDGSIRDNILLELDYDKARYDRLAKLLNLEAIFLKFDEHDFSDSIRELNFSEKFMLNLARALYRNTSILLIEDVIWKLDEYWKKIVIESVIFQEFVNKTWIIITHDESLLSKSSKIVFMDNKKVREVGTLKEMRNKECFKDLQE